MYRIISKLLSGIGKVVMEELPSFMVILLLLSIPASYEIVNGKHFAKMLFLTAVIQAVPYAFVACLLAQLTNRYIRWIIITVCLLLFIVESFVYLRFDTRMTPIIFSFIIQTDIGEASAFVNAFVLNKTTLVCLTFLLLLYFTYHKINNWWKHKSFVLVRNGRIVGFVIIIFSIGGITMSMQAISMKYKTVAGIVTIHQLLRSMKLVNHYSSDVNNIYNANKNIKVTHTPETSPIIVCVMGESHIKAHSSLYGYPLPTNPRLLEERDRGNLYVYNDVVSVYNGTTSTMRLFYSLKSANDTTTWELQPLFPAVFRKAGFRVSLFDNQETRNSTEGINYYSLSYFIAEEKIHDQCFSYRNTQRFGFDDMELVKNYAEHFDHGNKSVNLFHLYGQHVDAKDHYPHTREWETFSANDIRRKDLNERERQIVAEYDNATRYNDAVLAFIIDQFRNDDAVIVHLSDHGEQVYDDERHLYGRTYGGFSDLGIRCMYELPFFIWVSDTFKKLHPEKFHQIASSVDNPFSSDDVCYLLFDLADVDFVGNKPERSMINPNYNPKDRILIMNEKKFNYDKNKKRIKATKLLIE